MPLLPRSKIITSSLCRGNFFCLLWLFYMSVGLWRHFIPLKGTKTYHVRALGRLRIEGDGKIKTWSKKRCHSARQVLCELDIRNLNLMRYLNLWCSCQLFVTRMKYVRQATYKGGRFISHFILEVPQSYMEQPHWPGTWREQWMAEYVQRKDHLGVRVEKEQLGQPSPRSYLPVACSQ